MPELAITFLGEEFYWIPAYRHRYSISKSAKVYDHNLKCLLVIGARKAKYIAISLRGVNGAREPNLVHRLVANTFLGLDLSKFLTDFVDHIDGNPHNNDLTNLRVCSPSQNIQWAKGIGELDTYDLKQCRRCKELKPRSEYHSGGSSLDHVKAYCNDCRSKENYENRVRLKGNIPKDFDTSTHKYCRNCKILKPRNEFGLNSSSKDKLSTYCKLCVNSKYK